VPFFWLTACFEANNSDKRASASAEIFSRSFGLAAAYAVRSELATSTASGVPIAPAGRSNRLPPWIIGSTDSPTFGFGRFGSYPGPPGSPVPFVRGATGYFLASSS
jgi:hypothetical protein